MTRNSQSPDSDTYLKHLAIALRDNADLEAVKERRKKHRTTAKDDGIDVKDMDQDIKMSGWSPSEIATWFSRKIAYLGYRGVAIGKQFDLFSGVNPSVSSAPDFRPSGMYAAMKGQPCKPPSNIAQSEAQQWTEGWHEGHKFFSMAAEASSLASAAAAAITADDNEDHQDGDQSDQGEGGLAPLNDGDLEEETLFLALGDFAKAESLADCTFETYSGPPADLAEARRVVVEFDGEEKVLKDANGPGLENPPAEAGLDVQVVSKADEFQEATPEELKAQAGRKPSEALSQSAKAAAAREAAEKPVKPKKPRSAKPTDAL